MQNTKANRAYNPTKFITITNHVQIDRTNSKDE